MLSGHKHLFVVLLWLVLPGVGSSQPVSVFGSASASPLTGTSPEASTRTIHGQVVNALNGAAIPRALVNLNSRQVLTDSQGRFQFPQFADVQASVSVIKPGFSQSAEAGEFVQQKILDLSSAVEVKLYPEAILTGTVAGADGLSLSQVPITLRRASYGVSGLRWINAGFSMTNSRGAYRFLVPAGRYRLSLGYVPRSRETQEAVIPVVFPGNSSSETSGSWIALTPGEEKQIDLRPKMGPTHPVVIRVDQTGSRQNLRFTAVPASGDTMNLSYTAEARQGEYRVELPSGSYVLHAQSDTREESLFGSGQVTVTGQEVPSLTLHLAPATSLPIEIAADPASNGQKTPTTGYSAVYNVLQFGLTLYNVSGGSDPANPDIPARISNVPDRVKEDRTFEFRVPAGRYRLTGNSNGAWFVESATYGGIVNLLTSDLVVAAGSAGQPIRIVASNLRGNIRGQVSLPEGTPTAWVYFFPRQPALAVPNAQATGSAGGFFGSVPVGSYSVVAFAHRIQEDLRDSDVVQRLTAGAKVVEVTSSTDSLVNLDLSQAKEVPE